MLVILVVQQLHIDVLHKINHSSDTVYAVLDAVLISRYITLGKNLSNAKVFILGGRWRQRVKF